MLFGPDDDGEFPPTKHPGREAFSLVFVIVVLLGIAGWALWVLAFAALRVWG